jgi:RNA polymerase primary sigma factor
MHNSAPQGLSWDEHQIYQQYLKDISKYPLLNKDEERLLIQKAASGNRRAMDRLVVSNLRFVINIAFMYRGQGMTVNELINEGNMGLMEAARRFDPSQEIKFISYAVWWIRQSITRAIAEKARLVRISAEKELVLRRLNRKGSALRQVVGGQYVVDTGDLEGVTQYKGEQIEKILTMGQRHMSFDTPMNDEGDSSLLDFTADDGEAPDASIEERSRDKMLRQALDQLNPQEREVLEQYFGVRKSDSLNLQEIGKKIGLSKERVRQVKERGLASLRQQILNEELDHAI